MAEPTAANAACPLIAATLPTLRVKPSSRVRPQRAGGLAAAARLPAPARPATAPAERGAAAEAWLNAGRTHAAVQDHERAVSAFAAALEQFQAAADHRGAAAALTETAEVFRTLGDLGSALDYLDRALALQQEIGDRLGRARSLRRAGEILTSAGDAGCALERLRSSLALCSEVAHPQERARILVALGVALRALGRLDESAAAIEEAVAVFRDNGSEADLVGTLVELATTLMRNGAPLQADELWATVRERAARLDLPGSLARAWLGRGEVALGTGDTTAAERAFGEALEQSARTGDLVLLARCHEALAVTNRAREDWSAALVQMDLASEARDAHRRADLAARLRAAAIRRQASAEGAIDHGQIRASALAKVYAELETLNASLRAADVAKTELLATLERKTFEDVLTGLYNRRYAELRLAEEFQRALRHDRPIAAAIVDVDRFRRVNEEISHAAGDKVLRSLARLIAQCLRTTDIAARYGGDQFVIVFPETDEEGAASACEKIRTGVEGFAWDAIHPGLDVTVSIGLTSASGLPNHEKMLAVADRMLSDARARARNRVYRPARG